METKDYVYLSLIGLTAAVFYWHGFLAARCRARKNIAAMFNDSRAVLELPHRDTEPAPPMSGYRGMRPGTPRRTRKIRAVFGIN